MRLANRNSKREDNAWMVKNGSIFTRSEHRLGRKQQFCQLLESICRMLQQVTKDPTEWKEDNLRKISHDWQSESIYFRDALLESGGDLGLGEETLVSYPRRVIIRQSFVSLLGLGEEIHTSYVIVLQLFDEHNDKMFTSEHQPLEGWEQVTSTVIIILLL